MIQALLQACPESAQIADVYGRLPLHYAVDKAVLDAEVVLCLLAAFPAGEAGTLSRADSLPQFRGFL